MSLTRTTNYADTANPIDPTRKGLHSVLQDKAQLKLPSLQKEDAVVRGVCFRVSYKWLVTTWKGLQFKGADTNMEKTYAKQMDYLKQADVLSTGDYATWFQNANTLSQTTLQAWGGKHGHSCAAPYTTDDLGAAAPLQGNPDTAMIVGFFGTKTAGGVWGHATAYCCRNNKPQFFDINYGVYKFDPGDDRGDVMQKWIQAKYVNADKTIKDFVLYQIY